MMNRSLRAQSNFVQSQKLQGLAQISSLQQNVQILAAQNKEKYFTIISSQPNYGVALYQPKESFKAEKLFKKQLLLKQLDRLMDQQSIFDKKITHINVLKQLESQQIDIEVQKELNPYLSLRNAWSKHQKTSTDLTGTDRLQSLNFTIGVIKNTVLAMKNIEQHSQPSYMTSSCFSEQQKLQKLQQKYERSQMINEQLRQQVYLLHQKLQQKQQNQRKITIQMQQKEKQILSLKKTISVNQHNHKIQLSLLNQNILNVEKDLQKINKWKLKIEKNQYLSNEGTFKLFIETTEIQDQKNTEPKCKATSKKLFEIQAFISQYSPAAPLSIHQNPQQQQNHQIVIPTLSLTQNSQQIYTRKKFNTERALKVKNFEFQKFVGKRLVNLKDKRSSFNVDINDETAKKFVRKSQIIVSDRQMDYQFSQRVFQKVDSKGIDHQNKK